MGMTVMPGPDDTVGLLMLFEEPSMKIFSGRCSATKEYYLQKLTPEERVEYQRRLKESRRINRIIWAVLLIPVAVLAVLTFVAGG